MNSALNKVTVPRIETYERRPVFLSQKHLTTIDCIMGPYWTHRASKQYKIKQVIKFCVEPAGINIKQTENVHNKKEIVSDS